MLYATLICLDSITHARMYRLHQAPTGDTATTRTRSARCGVSARAVRPRLARVRARRRVQVHCEFWARARHPPRTSTPGRDVHPVHRRLEKMVVSANWII
jgi:hypothetical protein